MLIPFVDSAMQGKIEEVRRLSADLGASHIEFKHVSKDTTLYFVDSWTRVIVSSSMMLAEHRAGVRYERAA